MTMLTSLIMRNAPMIFSIGLVALTIIVFSDSFAGTTQKNNNNNQAAQTKHTTRIQQSAPSAQQSEQAKKNATNASSLKKKFDSSANSWKKAQADHAWQRRGAQSWQKRGVHNPAQLQNYVESIRRNPDIKKNLTGGRIAYGKHSSSQKMAGVVVVDNPADKKNGGTVLFASNVQKRIRQLK